MATRIRRTPDEWQHILDEFDQSGLTVTRFCEDHQLHPTLFYRWRKKLQHAAITPLINLTPMLEPQLPDWDVELELGHGIVLRMRCNS